MLDLHAAWWKETNVAHDLHESKQDEIHAWDFYAKSMYQPPKTEKTVLSEY